MQHIQTGADLLGLGRSTPPRRPPGTPTAPDTAGASRPSRTVPSDPPRRPTTPDEAGPSRRHDPLGDRSPAGTTAPRPPCSHRSAPAAAPCPTRCAWVTSAKHHRDAIDASAAQHDHRPARPQLPVQLVLPNSPRRDPDLRVEIQEKRSVALRRQPGPHVGRYGIVPAAVADEDRRHRHPCSQVRPDTHRPTEEAGRR